MKVITKIRLFSFVLAVIILFTSNTSAYAKTPNTMFKRSTQISASINPELNKKLTEKIGEYARCVNNKLMYEYISLFDKSTQVWMNECTKDENFFLGEKIAIIRSKALSSETGVKAAFIEPYEFEDKPFIVYYVEAKCDTSEVTSENIKPLNGDILYVFVFVLEENDWKIGRVSIADSTKVAESGEGFNDAMENQILIKEKRALHEATLSEPSTICIKMTKTKNKKYWGAEYVTLNFKDYILNVVPNEFYVSEGGEYLKAGTMAVKMFSWYHVIHKKYPNSPGGCDLQDTSVDQKYVATSYADLGRYKSKMDDAYDAIDGIALVDNSGTIFETQYIEGTTDSKVGKLGTDTASSLSDEGKSYKEILKDAYNKSQNANKKTVKFKSY